MAVDALVAGLLCILLPETNKVPTAETLTDEKQEALLCDMNAANEQTMQNNNESRTGFTERMSVV